MGLFDAVDVDVYAHNTASRIVTDPIFGRLALG